MNFDEEFAQFWAVFPRRTAKLDAMKAYGRARSIASAAEILDGVQRYKRTKPEYADWCHPATFLNKGRWMDEDDEPILVQREYWYDECQREHGGACVKQWDHVIKMRESA